MYSCILLSFALRELTVTLDQALELAQGKEAATQNAKCLQNPESIIKALSKTEAKTKRRQTEGS